MKYRRIVTVLMNTAKSMWYMAMTNDLSETKSKSLQYLAIFLIYNLWPLLLTWFNFNPSMDK